MPDLTLAPVVAATQPDQLLPALEGFFGAAARHSVVEATRLQPPLFLWVVYRAGSRRVTLKSFFSQEHYQQYVEQLEAYYPDRLETPAHPLGGLRLLPEVNGVLWAFPFDPVMPALDRCLDGAWIASTMAHALRRPAGVPLHPRLLHYTPEIGAVFAYREPPSRGLPKHRRVVAYGKCAPDDVGGRIFVIMDRLWHSAARRTGQLRLARPLAFRSEPALLLQAPVPGKPVPPQRNRRIFLELVQHAGAALAAIHQADVPFGPERHLDHYTVRLQHGVSALALTSPSLYATLRLLVERLTARAKRLPPQRLMPSHGDFKWDQFLEANGRFALIDFELFCQAERAHDLGYFCAYLTPSAPQDWRESKAAEVLRQAFFDAYARASGEAVDLARIALYEAAALGIRALTFARGQRPGWEQRAGHMLELALERLVDPVSKSAG